MKLIDILQCVDSRTLYTIKDYFNENIIINEECAYILNSNDYALKDEFKKIANKNIEILFAYDNNKIEIHIS